MNPNRCLHLILALILILPGVGWAKFGIVKTRARYLVFHPPAFYSPNRELRIEADSVDLRTGYMLVPRLQHFLGEALQREGFKVAPGARAVLKCTVTNADAALDTQVRSESVNVHVGEHTETDKDGKSKQVEDCKTQTGPVTYLISAGRLVLDVKARDSTTQDTLMNQPLERRYRQESAIAGPKRCGGDNYGVVKGQLQDPFAILGLLGDQAVADVVRLAAGFDEPREVLLAVDDDLKGGNAQAVAGAWQQALDTWTEVQVSAKSTVAARQYNIGVAHEVLGATAMREGALDEAAAHFEQAQANYAQALKIDPDEKYFRDALPRLDGIRGLLAQEQDEISRLQPETAVNVSSPQRPAPRVNSPSIPLGGWPAGESDAAHDFRVYVRTRVGAQKQEPGESLRQELLESASDYRVPPDLARQVVDSEVQRFSVLRQRVEQYHEDFQDAAADGVITSDERQMLIKRQQILQLPDAQVREVESQFRFKEQR